MHAQVSKCYYHPEIGAVATCAKCGVGICRDCAVKDDRGRIICYQCGNKDLKQGHKEYRKRLRENGGRFRTGAEFILPGSVGILIAIAFGAFLYYVGMDSQIVSSLSIDGSRGSLLLTAYCLFSSPFGYIVLNDLFAPKYDRAINVICDRFMTVFFSPILGSILFAFFGIRFIIRRIMLKKNKT